MYRTVVEVLGFSFQGSDGQEVVVLQTLLELALIGGEGDLPLPLGGLRLVQQPPGYVSGSNVK